VTARIALLAAGILLVVGAAQSGLLETLADRDRASALLEDLGLLGPLLYVLAFAMLEPFFVPTILFIMGASAVWPLWTAYGLSLLGATGAGVVGFGFARFLARDWVESRLPERFRRYDEELAGPRGFRTVLWVRLIFFLAPPAHWVLGLSKVRFTPFLVGTVIGFAPMLLLLTWLCFEFSDWLLTAGPRFFLIPLAVVGGAILIRRMRRKTKEPDPVS